MFRKRNAASHRHFQHESLYRRCRYCSDLHVALHLQVRGLACSHNELTPRRPVRRFATPPCGHWLRGAGLFGICVVSGLFTTRANGRAAGLSVALRDATAWPSAARGRLVSSSSSTARFLACSQTRAMAAQQACPSLYATPLRGQLLRGAGLFHHHLRLRGFLACSQTRAMAAQQACPSLYATPPRGHLLRGAGLSPSPIELTPKSARLTRGSLTSSESCA